MVDTWVLATHVGDQDGAVGPWLWPISALPTESIFLPPVIPTPQDDGTHIISFHFQSH